MRTKTKPVLPNLSNPGVRRVSRSTVTATRASIEADERLRDLLGAEPITSARPKRGRASKAITGDHPVKLGDGAPRRKNSRAKGKVGELEFKELLREAGWPNARRGQQRAGVEQADVIDGPPGVHFEVKRVENLNVWAAHEQATRDARDGEVPVVAMRRNRSSWLAVLPMCTLLLLLQVRRAACVDTTSRPPLDVLLS